MFCTLWQGLTGVFLKCLPELILTQEAIQGLAKGLVFLPSLSLSHSVVQLPEGILAGFFRGGLCRRGLFFQYGLEFMEAQALREGRG
ncbi:Uncharacterised protein [Serratia quinivorans]|nr:Uncharacterised protein [Serratia quinivorans]